MTPVYCGADGAAPGKVFPCKELRLNYTKGYGFYVKPDVLPG